MPAKYLFDRTDVTFAIYRVLLAGLMLAHPVSQLTALWQAALANPGGFPSAAVVASAIVPKLFALGAILLMIGFKTRPVAFAMLLLIAGVTLFDLLIIGIPAGSLGYLARLTVMIGLLLPMVTGGGRLSVDGWKRARLVIRNAE